MKKIYKPILFSTEMVQAILAGRKTQTRRFACYDNLGASTAERLRLRRFEEISQMTDGKIKPKYNIGDILWVRETFVDVGDQADRYFGGVQYRYKADNNFVGCWPWKPSIFMPKEAARIFLKVTNVRCERLQDIEESDAIAEGVYQHSDYGSTGYCHYGRPEEALTDIDAVWSFETLWESINGKDSWQSNPWVWIYEFKKVEKPTLWPQ